MKNENLKIIDFFLLQRRGKLMQCTKSLKSCIIIP